MKLFPTSFLLGLAGIDPTGALVIITALTKKVNKNKISLFVITAIIATLLVGLVGGNFIINNFANIIAKLFNYLPEYIYMILEFIIGIILLIWFIERIIPKDKIKIKKESFFTKSIKKGLFFVGIIFAITAPLDPSFLAIITLVGHNNNIIENILSILSWVLISQLPMIIIYITVILNKDKKLINYLQNNKLINRRKDQIKKVLNITLSIIILLSSVLSITESIYYFFTNNWLF